MARPMNFVPQVGQACFSSSLRTRAVSRASASINKRGCKVIASSGQADAQIPHRTQRLSMKLSRSPSAPCKSACVGHRLVPASKRRLNFHPAPSATHTGQRTGRTPAWARLSGHLCHGKRASTGATHFETPGKFSRSPSPGGRDFRPLRSLQMARPLGTSVELARRDSCAQCSLVPFEASNLNRPVEFEADD